MHWRAFPLHPDTPEEGRLLRELFSNVGAADIEKMLGHLRETAADLGLLFKERDKTYNSRLAQELGLWAASKNKGDPFDGAVFRAYFGDGKNIAKIPVLIDLAEAVGLPREEALQVVEKRRFESAVDADWARSQEHGITAVPTLMLEGSKLVGAQPYDVLTQFLETRGIRKRQAPQV